MIACRPQLRACCRAAVDASLGEERARNCTHQPIRNLRPWQCTGSSPTHWPVSFGSRLKQQALYRRVTLLARESPASARDNDGASSSGPPEPGSTDAGIDSGDANKQEAVKEEASNSSEACITIEPGSQGRTAAIRTESDSSQDHSTGPAAAEPFRSKGSAAGIDQLLMKGEVSDASPVSSLSPPEPEPEPVPDSDTETQPDRLGDSSMRASTAAPLGTSSTPDRDDGVLAAASGMAAGLRASDDTIAAAASGSNSDAERPGSLEQQRPR